MQQVVDPALHQPVPAPTRERLATAWETIARRSLERTLDLVASASFEAEMRGIDAPALVVTGAHDPRHGAHADLLLDDLPHARHVVLDAGGEISAEAPAELAALIHQVVAEVGRSR